MDRLSDQAVVERIIEYLDGATEQGHGHLIAATGPTQEVEVPSGQWRDHLKELDLSEPVQRGVHAALDRIAQAGDRVDRSLLTELATRTGNGDDERVALWFATMCWGAGPRENFRVRQWRQALTWGDFTDTLEATQRNVAGGQLAEAHRGAWMPGTGEAFFTKWLWALGLPGIDGAVTPYVLDARVRNSLHAAGWWPQGRGPAARWVEYCTALDRWADDIRTVRTGWSIDGGRLEHMLFERCGDGCDFYSTVSS